MLKPCRIEDLSYAEACAYGIGHLHPDAPGNRSAQPPPPTGFDPRSCSGDRPRRSKYGNQITVYNGVKYSSKAEALRAERLDHEMSIGAVAWWVRQVTFRLGVSENVYIIDFLVQTADLRVHAEDVKGISTPKFKRDVRLWEAYGRLDLWIIRRGKVEEIIRPRTKTP